MLSVIHTHHHLDISATDRAAGVHIDESIDTSSIEPRVAARDKCDAISLPDQTHLTAVSAGAGGAVDVEVVAVATAGDAVAASWSSASSSSRCYSFCSGCRGHKVWQDHLSASGSTA